MHRVFFPVAESKHTVPGCTLSFHWRIDMRKWVRQNLVLVAGIVLPVLLVAGFMLLQGVPKVLADPPQYDFLVVGYHYDARQAPAWLSAVIRGARRPAAGARHTFGRRQFLP
jgi:hypothetical protein